MNNGEVLTLNSVHKVKDFGKQSKRSFLKTKLGLGWPVGYLVVKLLYSYTLKNDIFVKYLKMNSTTGNYYSAAFIVMAT